MKKFNLLAGASALALVVSACNRDDPVDNNTVVENTTTVVYADNDAAPLVNEVNVADKR